MFHLGISPGKKRCNPHLKTILVFLALGILIPLLFSGPGCSHNNKGNDNDGELPWEILVTENDQWTGETSCWEGYNEDGSPGKYYEYREHGLRIDRVHPEYFAKVESDGSLTKPGYQDEGHKGTASIDYTGVMELCQGYHDHNTKICFALFIHNFETVTYGAMKNFFKNWSTDLKIAGIDSIIFIPAWEIQGQWAAWIDGATRDCYIDPSVFNSQMAVFKNARDDALTDIHNNGQNGAEILLGAVVNSPISVTYFNSYGYSAMDYLDGLREAEWAGLDYYPVKAGKTNGPQVAFQDALTLYSALGTSPNFGIFEYAPNTDSTYGDPNWTNQDKISFIRQTYQYLNSSQYSFIKQMNWWFIGKGNNNTRISCE